MRQNYHIKEGQSGLLNKFNVDTIYNVNFSSWKTYKLSMESLYERFIILFLKTLCIIYHMHYAFFR